MVYLGDSSSPGKGRSVDVRHSFPQLGIEVTQPRPGTALLWPNVFNAEPTKPDPRTMYDVRIQKKRQGKTDEEKHYYTLHGAVYMHDILTLENDGCLSS